MLRRGDGTYSHELVEIRRPILKTPTLAIHLNRGSGQDFKFTLQENFPPILATQCKHALMQSVSTDNGDSTTPPYQTDAHPLLLRLLALELNCDVSEIIDFELQLCDSQPGEIVGGLNEFISCGRLDNLVNCFCSTKALVATSTDEALANETAVRMIAMFGAPIFALLSPVKHRWSDLPNTPDNEEVGSASVAGAGGPLMIDSMKRVSAALAPGP
eukprot:SAG31_NODE_6498_length_1995_cov_0.972574_1_plen_215_part_00